MGAERWQPLQREPLAAGVEKLSFPADEQLRAAKRSPTWRRPAAERYTVEPDPAQPLEDLRRDAVRGNCWPPSVSPSWHSC